GTSIMKRVLIIESQMNQYRLPFYTKLYEALREEGISLKVAYSDPPPLEAMKRDTFNLPLEFGKKVSAYWILRGRLIFQPVLGEVLCSDLVVVEQANKFILNHFLLPPSWAGLKRIAFWGHGENRQVGRSRVFEWYRRITINWAFWWFAYTQVTTDY